MEAEEEPAPSEKAGGKNMTNLIIVSCSKTKKRLDSVPAIDLYNGQAYRVIRKSSLKDLEVLIISAKYGLLRSTDIISYYDQVMTVSRATEMQGHVSHGIRNTLSSLNPAQVFISLGFPYDMAISQELIDFLDVHFDLRIASGPIGKRLHQLKEWLESLKKEVVN